MAMSHPCHRTWLTITIADENLLTCMSKCFSYFPVNLTCTCIVHSHMNHKSHLTDLLLCCETFVSAILMEPVWRILSVSLIFLILWKLSSITSFLSNPTVQNDSFMLYFHHTITEDRLHPYIMAKFCPTFALSAFDIYYIFSSNLPLRLVTDWIDILTWIIFCLHNLSISHNTSLCFCLK